MARFHDVKQWGVSGDAREDSKVRSRAPERKKFAAKVEDRVGGYGSTGATGWFVGLVYRSLVLKVRFQMEMMFYAGEESEDVFLELEANEFFGAHVTMCVRPTGILWVPRIINGLSEEVDPPTVCSRQGECRP